MQPEPTKVIELGLVIDYYSLTRTLLERDNVPADAIIALHECVRSITRGRHHEGAAQTHEPGLH